MSRQSAVLQGHIQYLPGHSHAPQAHLILLRTALYLRLKPLHLLLLHLDCCILVLPPPCVSALLLPALAAARALPAVTVVHIDRFSSHLSLLVFAN